ncbi:MAG TPA: phage holin family protein [Gaiellaceae bacterium]
MSATQTKRGLTGSAKEVVGRAKSVARLQAQLAQAEIKQKLVKLGIGAGLAGFALLLLLYAVGFLLAGGAAGLAAVVPWWAALLIVGGVLLLIVAVLLLVAARMFRAGSPPVPEAAIEEARLTSETVRSNVAG